MKKDIHQLSYIFGHPVYPGFYAVYEINPRNIYQEPSFIFLHKNCTADSGRNLNKLTQTWKEFYLCFSRKLQYILFVNKNKGVPGVNSLGRALSNSYLLKKIFVFQV